MQDPLGDSRKDTLVGVPGWLEEGRQAQDDDTGGYERQPTQRGIAPEACEKPAGGAPRSFATTESQLALRLQAAAPAAASSLRAMWGAPAYYLSAAKSSRPVSPPGGSILGP